MTAHHTSFLSAQRKTHSELPFLVKLFTLFLDNPLLDPKVVSIYSV